MYYLGVFYVALALVAGGGLLSASERTWTSTDGKKFTGVLLAVDEEMVRIQRSSDRRQFRFPLARLSVEDQEFVRVTSAGKFIRLNAATISTDTERLERVAGTKTVRERDSNGNITSRQVDVIDKYSISGKTLRIDTSTTSTPLDAQIEVLFVSRDDGSKAVFDSHSRSISISPDRQTFSVKSKLSEHYYGWVVLVKHAKTGQIIATKASSRPLEQFALERVDR